MAERRMFAKTIIDSDAFLDMPLSSQALYFHLSMRADDEGFINNPRKLQRMIGCNDDDLKLLCAKNFLIPFESGVVVIKHWRIHNLIRGDRFKKTVYEDERMLLKLKDNMAYTLDSELGNRLATTWQPNDNQVATQDSIGKDSIGKVSIDKSIGARFAKPTLEEVQAYITEKGYSVDAERFVDYYESNGWKVGKNAMKDWKAAVRNWNKTDKVRQDSTKKNKFNDFPQREYDFEDLESKLMSKLHGKEAAG